MKPMHDPTIKNIKKYQTEPIKTSVHARSGCLTHFNGPLHLGLLVTKPHHPDDGQGDAEPVKEAEEVDGGVDVVGEGVQQRHPTLDRREQVRGYWSKKTNAQTDPTKPRSYLRSATLMVK